MAAKEMGIDIRGPVAAYSTGRYELAAKILKKSQILVRIHWHPDSVQGWGVERARGPEAALSSVLLLPIPTGWGVVLMKVPRTTRLAEGIEQEDAYARVAGVLPASRQP